MAKIIVDAPALEVPEVTLKGIVSPHGVSYLAKAGIYTLRDAAAAGELKLLRITGVARKTVSQIQKALRGYGFLLE